MDTETFILCRIYLDWFSRRYIIIYEIVSSLMLIYQFLGFCFIVVLWQIAIHYVLYEYLKKFATSRFLFNFALFKNMFLKIIYVNFKK